MSTGVALVTGGAQGLGAAIAQALHGVGYRVAVTDLSEEAAVAGARSLDASGKTAIGLPLDVRAKPAFEAARDRVLERWGTVDILVNNAVVTSATPVLDISSDEFDAVLTVNLRGTFLGCQVFGRLFKERGYGRIVNVASLAGQNGGTATGAHYAASKGAILTLTKVFARELAAHGVTVNAVAPGPLDLPSVREIVSPERLPSLVSGIPVGALGDPAFVADLVVLLARPEARFATGATFDVNGGLYMR